MGGMATHPNQIADAIRSNPAYPQGQPINLVMCHGSRGTAAELAQNLGAEVRATPHRVQLDPHTGALVTEASVN